VATDEDSRSKILKAPKTDPAAIVVPFGKHKGATVAELLAKDPQYADWVMAQGWVAERFAELHAAIATRGAGTDDTPEHNALQARFLDEGFRAATLRCVAPNKLAKDIANARENLFWREKEEREKLVKNISYMQERITESSDDMSDLPPDYRERRKSAIPGYHARIVEDQAKINALSETIEASLHWVLRPVTGVKFEVRGIDVVIDWTYAIPDGHRVGTQEWIGIELKPAIGDDYPTVMRQMKRLGCSVCVVGQYTGRGVSEVQLRQMFEANGQTLIFVQEIEEEARNHK